MINDAQVTVIRFIEEEYNIDNIIAAKIDVLTADELNSIIEPLIAEMMVEIASTLGISKNEAILIYDEYTGLMVKVSTMLLISEGTNE